MFHFPIQDKTLQCCLNNLGDRTVQLDLNPSQLSVFMLTLNGAYIVFNQNLKRAIDQTDGSTFPNSILLLNNFLLEELMRVPSTTFTRMAQNISAKGVLVYDQKSTLHHYRRSATAEIWWFVISMLLENLNMRANGTDLLKVYWASEIETFYDVAVDLSWKFMQVTGFDHQKILVDTWQETRNDREERIKLDARLEKVGSTEAR